MRGVLDTNTVLSGLLWHGPPRQVLDAARRGEVQLFTSPELLAELEDVLLRPKFTQRLRQAGLDAAQLIQGYAALATLVQPAPLPAVVLADPDDDAVLACAVAAQADFLISGDHHLLDLQSYESIPILTAPELREHLSSRGKSAPPHES